MNILITGSNGFIGRNLKHLLSQTYGYNITTLTRKDADLLDPNEVKSFFNKQKQPFDLVLHTATDGGRRTIQDQPYIVYNNLLMLYNLLACQSAFQCIISFGSGAELDRRYDINPQAINRYPIDPYGLSKSVIDKISATEPKLCNFRIYNCFGFDEQPDRMIRNNIIRYLNHENMIIHQDKKMDFFFVGDLAQLIHFFIDSNNIPKLFDCCYKDKTLLSDIANLINNLDDHKVDIIYENNDSQAKDYIGQYVETHVNYVGLQKAIEMMYQKYKNTKENTNGK
jgi:nucleoside-diphosphate-sugar epimerase